MKTIPKLELQYFGNLCADKLDLLNLNLIVKNLPDSFEKRLFWGDIVPCFELWDQEFEPWDQEFEWINFFANSFFACYEVSWHIDDVYLPWSVLLVLQSDGHVLRSTRYTEFDVVYDLKIKYPTEEQLYDFFDKNSKKITLKTGDVVLLNTGSYHKLENLKDSSLPFIFFGIDNCDRPSKQESLKVINYAINKIIDTMKDWS